MQFSPILLTTDETNETNHDDDDEYISACALCACVVCVHNECSAALRFRGTDVGRLVDTDPGDNRNDEIR